MNIIVNSQVLAVELRLLNRVVPTKPSIAILGHALLTADDQLRSYATDLEVSISTACQANVVEPGRVALPVARFLALVEQFPDADVSITANGQQVVVKCSGFTSKLQSMPVNDFPTQPTVEGEPGTIDAAALKQLITRTRYAVDATASKFILKGALLKFVGGGAAMVATDGKRLSMATAGWQGPDASIIIPAKALDLLASLPDGEVALTVGRQLHVTQGTMTMASRTIDGEFPKYERIIPRDNDKAFTVDRAALTSALKRVILVSEDNLATYLSIAPGTMELSSRSAEVGSADEAVAIGYEGVPLKVCVNGGYVLDFLDAAGDVTISLKDERSAMLLTDGDDHVGVIMLMRGT
jgi:DNA polymerase-3 subunit beta